MTMRALTAGSVGVVCICTSASAVWGLSYEVNTGSGWTHNAVVNVAGGTVSVDFRISAYFDSTTVITTASGTGPAIHFYRFTGSNKITSFGSSSDGDAITSIGKGTTLGGATALSTSVSGSDLIIGNGAATSFLSDLQLSGTLVQYDPLQGGTPEYVHTLVFGTMKIGNLTAGAQNRTITLTNNSFGISFGNGTPGLQFYQSVPGGSSDAGAPAGSPTFYRGMQSFDFGDPITTITVIPGAGSGTFAAACGLGAMRRRRRP